MTAPVTTNLAVARARRALAFYVRPDGSTPLALFTWPPKRQKGRPENPFLEEHANALLDVGWATIERRYSDGSAFVRLTAAGVINRDELRAARERELADAAGGSS